MLHFISECFLNLWTRVTLKFVFKTKLRGQKNKKRNKKLLPSQVAITVAEIFSEILDTLRTRYLTLNSSLLGQDLEDKGAHVLSPKYRVSAKS